MTEERLQVPMSQLEERSKRILTTHTGSLPRPEALSALLFARMSGKPHDAAELGRQTREAGAGIDIGGDGGQAKPGFQPYGPQRLPAIEPITPKAGERRTRENATFPT